MIDVLKIQSKSLKYTIGTLKEAWQTLISFDNSVGSRGRRTPLPTSKVKQFLSLLAVFAFILTEYVSEDLPMTACET